MAKKLTDEDIKLRLIEEFNNEYEMIGHYQSSVKPITLKHINCGNVYTVKRAKTFLKENGGKCPICCDERHTNKKPRTALSEEDFIKRIKEQVNDEYSYISGYKNTQEKVLMKHNICNTEYYVKPYLFLGKKQRRCPICGNLNRGKYSLKNNYLESLLEEKEYGNEYEWHEEYKGNNKIKHKIYHKECKNEYFVRPNDFQQGYKCPYCSNKNSDEEKELYEFIKDNYNGKIIYHYKDKLEIDIFLPELNIGFEYNGFYILLAL